MEPLEMLRAKITEFPGYDGDVQRRHSDEYVRSYLGEALSELGARCTVSSEVRARLDALTLRVGFSDPRDFVNHHAIAASSGADGGGAVAVADAQTIELADRAATLECAAVAPYLDEVEAQLGRREAAIRGRG